MATNTKDLIRRLRTGVPPMKRLTLGNNENSFDVAIVLLSSDDMLSINDMTDLKFDGRDVTERTRGMYSSTLMAWKCMREIEDPSKLVFDDFDEFRECIDLEDVQRITEKYNTLLVDKCPKLESITDEQFAELKDFFARSQKSDLNGSALVHTTFLYKELKSIQKIG